MKFPGNPAITCFYFAEEEMILMMKIKFIMRRVQSFIKSSRYWSLELSEDVRKALHLNKDDIREANQSEALLEYVSAHSDQDQRPDSRDLFSLEGKLLPCWLDSDLNRDDDWLTSPDYYPMYYLIFKNLSRKKTKSRFLEIGVRTGYMGVVFAKANEGPSFYVGVDPNLYIKNGLELAGCTLKNLRTAIHEFDFALIEGYSWESVIKNSLAHTGPFDIIHIDGDHTLPGKLNDLDLARQLLNDGGIILVDDYDHVPIVPEAVQRALTLQWFDEFAYIPTKRGLAVLRQKKIQLP